MPCKFVSHIKCPLKGTKLEEEAGKRGSYGGPWLALLPHPSSLMVPAHCGTGESYLWCIVARMDTSWKRQISYCRPECFEVTWLGLAAWQLSYCPGMVICGPLSEGLLGYQRSFSWNQQLEKSNWWLFQGKKSLQCHWRTKTLWVLCSLPDGVDWPCRVAGVFLGNQWLF